MEEGKDSYVKTSQWPVVVHTCVSNSGDPMLCTIRFPDDPKDYGEVMCPQCRVTFIFVRPIEAGEKQI
jgi:hypothetical protein